MPGEVDHIGAATAILLLLGALFMLLAALGALRMPDLLTRMHATTKASVLGAGLTLLGVAVHFWEQDVLLRVVAIVAFVTLTSPVAAHAIGRAGYRSGSPLWQGTLKDVLRDENSRAADAQAAGPQDTQPEPR